MNLKKLIAIFCSSLLLVGCSNNMEDKNHGLDKDNPITVTIGTLEDTSLQTMIDDFNTTIGNDRGINIQYKPVTSIDELSSMDMVSTDYDTIYTLCSNGNVAELSNYFSAMDLGSTYFETAIEDVSLSGLRAIPTKLDVNVLVLNKTEWESFSITNGLDSSSLNTWDSIVSVAETYQNSTNGQPFLSISSSYDVALEMAYQLSNPMTITSSDGAVINVQSDTMQTIWNDISVSQIKGLFVSGGYENIENNTTIASYCPLSEIPKDDDILILQAPIVNNDVAPYYKLNTTAIAINSTDDTKIYVGVQFIKWLTSINMNSEYSLNDGCIPTNKNFKESSNDSLISAYNINEDGESIIMNLLSNERLFKVSPFDNITTLKTTLETKINQTSVHDTIVKRIQGGVLESKAYEGILDSSSFKTWYDDLCEQLKITFETQQ